MLQRRCEAVLVDPMGLGKCRVDVAVMHPRPRRDVTVPCDERQHPVAPPVGMQQRRILSQRGFRVIDRVQRFDLHTDGRKRRLGDLQRRRRHRGDRVADEAHLVGGEDRDVLDGIAVADPRHVGRGDHGAHPGHRQRPARIDAQDFSARHLAAQDFPYSMPGSAMSAP